MHCFYRFADDDVEYDNADGDFDNAYERKVSDKDSRAYNVSQLNYGLMQLGSFDNHTNVYGKATGIVIAYIH